MYRRALPGCGCPARIGGAPESGPFRVASQQVGPGQAWVAVVSLSEPCGLRVGDATEGGAPR